MKIPSLNKTAFWSRVLIVILFILTTLLVLLTSLMITHIPKASAQSTSSDLNVSIESTIYLSLSNCDSSDPSSININIDPTSAGTFKSACQDIVVTTNTPGYSLSAKALSTDNTNNLLYQNPTTITPTPKINSTSSTNTLTNPATLSNNTWGFAMKQQTGMTNTNFDTTYTINDQNNKYANLPTTDTELYSTTTFPAPLTEFTSYYGTKIDYDTLAGTYQSTITYTALGSEPAPVPLKFKEIATGGFSFSCAIASDDNTYCWGASSNGQLGNGQDGNDGFYYSDTPVKVINTEILNGLTIKQLSLGGDHACVIASDDNVYCWGSNYDGQLGNGLDGYENNSNTPTPVSKLTGGLAGLTVKQIAAGTGTTCAIASDNNAYCWGSNFSGQLGNGKSTDSNIPVKVTNTGALLNLTVKQIVAGHEHTCAIASDNNAYCWGKNFSGQLGNGTVSNSSVPVKVKNNEYGDVLYSKTIKQISARGHATCVIASDDNAYCWGSNYYWQLGNGNSDDSSVPVSIDNTGVLSSLTIKQISSGGGHTCAIASDNNAYCWGSNSNSSEGDEGGQLGNGIYNDSNIPVKVLNNGVLNKLEIKQISSGGGHTCAIASDNNAYCWGSNNIGELGDGNRGTNSNVPVRVINPTL